MPDLKKLEQEACVVRENVGEEVDALKRMIANLTFKQAILALPYTQAKALADALQHEILEVENIIYQIQGNYMGEDGRQNHDSCTSLIQREEIPILAERLKAFAMDHPVK